MSFLIIIFTFPYIDFLINNLNFFTMTNYFQNSYF